MRARIEEARFSHLFTTDLQEIWQATLDGRGQLLVVQEDFKVPARVSPDGRTVNTETDTLSFDARIPDVLDVSMERHGGEVEFVEPGVVPHLPGALLTLRY